MLIELKRRLEGAVITLEETEVYLLERILVRAGSRSYMKDDEHAFWTQLLADIGKYKRG